MIIRFMIVMRYQRPMTLELIMASMQILNDIEYMKAFQAATLQVQAEIEQAGVKTWLPALLQVTPHPPLAA